MTEEKKLPTIEEWFEDRLKGKLNNCVSIPVSFNSELVITWDDAVNKALKDVISVSGRMFFDEENQQESENGLRNTPIKVDVDLWLSIRRDENGKIVYFIEHSKVELV